MVGDFVVTAILALVAVICAIAAQFLKGNNSKSGGNRPNSWHEFVRNHIRTMYKGAGFGLNLADFGVGAAEIAVNLRADGLDFAEFVGEDPGGIEDALREVGLIVKFGGRGGVPGKMSDRYVREWESGKGYAKLLEESVLAIADSPVEIREKMMKKWHEMYRRFVHDGGRYALDQNLRWYVVASPRGCKLLNGLEETVGGFMARVLSEPAKIAAGMQLYSGKPNLSADTTWTTEEYNLPEFQYTYIRLKSLQRYTECYSAYEVAFGKTVGEIRRVVAIGGGCGFELFALRDFLRERGAEPPTCTIIDVAETWKGFSDLIDCEYIIEDVNERGPATLRAIGGADLVIFSYVYRYLTEGFFSIVERDYPSVRLIFNERRLPVTRGIPSARRISDDLYIRGLPGNGIAREFIKK